MPLSFPAAHTSANRRALLLAVFTSGWLTQIRVMFLEHSPHSQKCSGRLLPVVGNKNELINLAIAQVVELPSTVRIGAVADRPSHSLFVVLLSKLT